MVEREYFYNPCAIFDLSARDTKSRLYFLEVQRAIHRSFGERCCSMEEFSGPLEAEEGLETVMDRMRQANWIPCMHARMEAHEKIRRDNENFLDEQNSSHCSIAARGFVSFQQREREPSLW